MRRILLLAALLLAAAPGAQAATVDDCRQDRDFDLAIRACTELLADQRASPSQRAVLYTLRCIAYRRKADFDRAVADCDQAVGLAPLFTPALTARAIAYLGRSQYDRALADVSRVVTIQPGSASYNNRAWILYKMGEMARAEQDVTKALELNPSNGAALDTRAHVRATLGRKEAALEDFRRAMRVDPELTRLYQKSLKDRGFFKGEVDGRITPALERALAACVAEFPRCDPLPMDEQKPVS